MKSLEKSWHVLCFKRCIVMRLFYFSYKQVKHDYSLLRAYAIICGRFNITVTETTCTPKIKVNLPVFVYFDSHLSLKVQ